MAVMSCLAAVALLVGAWIETDKDTGKIDVVIVALLVGAWIETYINLVI